MRRSDKGIFTDIAGRGLSETRRLALMVLCVVLVGCVSFGVQAQAQSGEDVGQLLKELHARQSDIRNQLITVSDSIDPQSDEERKIKDVLAALAGNELLSVIELLESVNHPENEEQVRSVGQQVAELQDRTIKVLRQILGLLAALQQEDKPELADEEGSDLPESTQEKLRDLLDKLKKFVDEQKKVIDSTEDLAKRFVDDFSDKDKKKLEELKATEDKWSKFMEEAYSDLSKLPEQDFSNPSLLKELIEIQSEVQKADDAIKKKAVEIAVPFEESGLELAKSLTTHLEKWLPDTPDRQKWSMEEPIQDVDTPMPELPQELEDIVGDLMEQEEDMFEDVEDLSSMWSDSLDKGAGWDTMDGPISNMSAQGVTGNRLPNNSEIGGRSGEGRTGKSNGEFVEQTATGKGGRNTPTRLTPDPWEAGQVKDTSKEPPGGATGGGKLSGEGSEGLEGPPPPPLKQQLDALAGRQAAIRNKAERINLALKVMNYPSQGIQQTLEMMKEVEGALKSGRYQSVPRKRVVLLSNLKKTKMQLTNDLKVRRDYSLGLPKELQDEVLDAMGQQAPPGFEHLLKSYYQALAQSK